MTYKYIKLSPSVQWKTHTSLLRDTHWGWPCIIPIVVHSPSSEMRTLKATEIKNELCWGTDWTKITRAYIHRTESKWVLRFSCSFFPYKPYFLTSALALYPFFLLQLSKLQTNWHPTHLLSNALRYLWICLKTLPSQKLRSPSILTSDSLFTGSSSLTPPAPQVVWCTQDVSPLALQVLSPLPWHFLSLGAPLWPPCPLSAPRNGSAHCHF